MPTLSGPFANLASKISRARGTVPLAVIFDGVRTDLDKMGVPLRGFFWEGTVEMSDSDGHAVTSTAPMLSLCLADLPRAPKRGDVIVFDDGQMQVAAPPQPTGGGSTTLILSRV